MSGSPIYSAEHMKRIAFVNGQVLHDFHLNDMQKNIAESIKLQTTRSKYDFYLLISPYQMYFLEPFVNTLNRGPNSTAQLNQLTFTIGSGSWETSFMEIPEVTDEFCLISNFEDYPDQGAYVSFYYRTNINESWKQIFPDEPVYLDAPAKHFQVKVECTTVGTLNPVVHDFIFLWK